MTHILDNPIWNALTTHNQDISTGNNHVRYFDREIAAFAGLKDNSEEDLNSLYALTPSPIHFILFTPGEISIPTNWKILVKRELLQMVCEKPTLPGSQLAKGAELIPLQTKDVPAMLELTAKTNPGPFFVRTIEFGGYHGIFDGDRLVAMTGRRMQPGPYVEVSAVCTHPDYTGRGYAAQLVNHQLQSILTESRIPFLHLFSDNIGAYKVYKKLGFETRREMMVYVIEKQDK
ncbi:GNAT family N-acetyltransferase [Cytophagaceae bacterium YF14B1]|uniref:GNAT family N-acetyltransferase n=1 Tax=Xanthocytophaga flava TaxID=3048013 RepID=A0AAE3QXS2_9BACT|nr:GNAT family N-acetyltransferase [Xanthocytophaga flavus]MDJ1485125.1 GNAT family N-acetyltransferase [Xanthocytophaga flavus]